MYFNSNAPGIFIAVININMNKNNSTNDNLCIFLNNLDRKYDIKKLPPPATTMKNKKSYN